MSGLTGVVVRTMAAWVSPGKTAGTSSIPTEIRFVDVRRRSTITKDLLVGAGMCFVMLAMAALVSQLPIANELGERLAMILLWPLFAITRILGRLVDVLGPDGRAEPASSYLPPWAVHSLAIVSVALLWLFCSGIAHAVRLMVARVSRQRDGQAEH